MKLTGTLHPWASSSKSGRVRSHDSGRVCAQPGCRTVLSIYNATRYCALHAVNAARDGRRRAPEPTVREATCAHCGTAFETSNLVRKFCSDRCRMAAFARRKRAVVRAKLARLPEQEAAI